MKATPSKSGDSEVPGDGAGKTGNSSRPVLFGEVLFDRFPDGGSVLGGAPFNVAWHLGGFGRNPLLVTRIGRDREGLEVLLRMEEWGLATEGVQADPKHPTGRVQVEFQGSHTRFEIGPDQAWDRIDGEQALAAIGRERPSILYHGSLACRSAESREALARLRRESGSPVFMDLNLRAPWWNHLLLEDLLPGCRWVKMNEQELEQLTGERIFGRGELEARARRLMERYAWEWLIVTRGSEGGCLFTSGCAWWEESLFPLDAVDTVGAGDAFSAVAMLGLELGWDPARTLCRAVRFASETCRRRGAVSEDRGLYRFQR